ncbi:ABC transporter substrate-binding protein [Paenibacillus sp. MMS20-IR301]|uniref:ABC transporter substrate-binding protein n=1 Tax=Paenibacillus sp. MMS20-IR301 TaxID=2895946 RepID=UPI0028E6F5E0|nr:ABC transporter substrate-binding protein [Paenibacillus sp. MMS20-IR301]WNS40719.1 ABC transporter substrate-binding protein [Paenibacillus sp. MMS20-IR301]
MKRLQTIRMLSLPLLLAAMLSLSACYGNPVDNSNPAADGPAATSARDGSSPDHSKEVKIVGYLLGSAPKGMPEVLAAINEKLKRDINATLEINYIGWGDVASRYPLLLVSGEDVDFVFAADWNYYVSEASKGAFLNLSGEMLNTYMPAHMARLPAAALEAAKVNGKVFMVPTSTPDRKVNVAMFRKDIMKQAGMTDITEMSQIEPYLAEVKRSYPDMIPLNLESQYDLPTPYHYLLAEKLGWPGAPVDSGDPLSEGITFDNDDPSGKIVSMMEEPYLSAQKYAAGIMKDWYDKGYINKNPYANKVRSKDNFINGKTGVAFGNTTDVASVLTSAKEKGIEVYLKPMLYPSGRTAQTSWINNGVAVAANSKNPERTLEALDLLMEDPAYVTLAYFGIEGVNYAITSDDRLGLPEGVTNDSNTYPPDAAGFWFVNKDLFKPMATWTDSYIGLQGKIKDYLVPVPYLGFTFNSENIKTEVANIKNVSTQYAQPIFIGAVNNVDEAFDILDKKLKAAGIDRVKAEVEQQAAEFLAAKQQ